MRAQEPLIEIVPCRFSDETEDLLSEHHSEVWDMIQYRTYYEDAATEKFKKLEELFPLFPATDQRRVKECIGYYIEAHKGTDEAKILQAFIEKYDNDQKKALLEEPGSAGVDTAQKKSPPKNKKIHKEDK